MMIGGSAIGVSEACPNRFGHLRRSFGLWEMANAFGFGHCGSWQQCDRPIEDVPS
jgi:hypothetical protein